MHNELNISYSPYLSFFLFELGYSYESNYANMSIWFLGQNILINSYTMLSKKETELTDVIMIGLSY